MSFSKKESQNCNISNINEVIIQTFPWVIDQLYSKENKVPEHSLKLERWQSPPHINKGKQY